MYILALQCAVVAYVYSEILISHGHIMYPFHKWLTAMLTKEEEIPVPDNTPAEVKAMPGYKPITLRKHIITKSPLLKPLGDCPLCMSGQLMLWCFIANLFTLPVFITLLCNLIFTICFAILLTLVFKKGIEKWGR